MSAKSKKIDKTVSNSGSGENLTAKRPGSAKARRPGSADVGKYSARSTASLDSDVSDLFLSVTGTRTVSQKFGQHKRSGSAGVVKSQHNDVHMSGSDTDSARTSSSSGARRKTTNTHRAQGVKLSEDHIPLIMSQAKARVKPKLATNFQGHNAAKSSPSSLPDRPSASLQNTIEPDDVEEWWKTLSDPAPVPPLLLQSSVESQKGLNWLSVTHNTNNHFGGDSAQNDVDNQMVFFASMEQNVSDFDLVEGNSRVKLDKSVSRRDDIPKLFLDDLIEDQSDSKRRRAAINIQRWFRGWKTRKELRGENAVKELLSQKKIEKEKQILDNAYSPGLEELSDEKEEEKRKRREEKARLARQAAIEELQKKTRREKKPKSTEGRGRVGFPPSQW